jgi:hypothetical protein
VVLLARGVVMDLAAQACELAVEIRVRDTQGVQIAEGSLDPALLLRACHPDPVAGGGVVACRRMDDGALTAFVHVDQFLELREQPRPVGEAGSFDVRAETSYLIVLVDEDIDDIGSGHSYLFSRT